MDDDQTPWLRLALCPQTPPSLLRELLCSPPELRHQINQSLARWFAESCKTDPPRPSGLSEEFDATADWQTLATALLSPKVSERLEKTLEWEAERTSRHVLTPAHSAWPQQMHTCLLYTSPSPRDKRQSRMPSSA